MTFKPAIWRPIAAVLSIVNLVAVGFAAAEAQPWHAGVHAALALVFGVWAERLRRAPRGSELSQDRLDTLDALEALETDVSKIRQEVSEMQERLDFTERVLAQGPESRRMEPPR